MRPLGKSVLSVVAAIGLAVLVWAFLPEKTPQCTDRLGCVEIPAEAPIGIGVIEALSGKVGRLGTEQLRGLQLALEEHNNKILGHPVRLVIQDSDCLPEGGANAALRIVSDPRIVAIFGPTCSAAAAAPSQVMTEAGLSMISGNSSAPFLTSMGGRPAPKWQPGFFRTAPNEEHSGAAAARYAYQALGARKAAAIPAGDIYTLGLANGFKREFERLGGKMVFFSAVDKGDRDMGPVIEAVAASHADLLFFPLFQPEGNHVLLAARSQPALAGVTLMSDGSLIEQSFIDAVGDAARGMYFVGPTPPDPSEALTGLEKRYTERFGEKPPTAYYSCAYDGAGILLAAIERAAKTGSHGMTIIGRQALRDALAATRHYPGVTGSLSCDTFGDCAKPRFNVLRLDDPSRGVAGLLANSVFTYTPGQAHEK